MDDKNYGINVAILLGDLLLSKTYDHIQRININNVDKYKEINQYFTDITSEVAIGQYYDLYACSTVTNEIIY